MKLTTTREKLDADPRTRGPADGLVGCLSDGSDRFHRSRRGGRRRRLILRWAFGVAPALTALAAVGLAIVMAGAVLTHVRRGEFQQVVMNAVMLALFVFVAAERL